VTVRAGPGAVIVTVAVTTDSGLPAHTVSMVGAAVTEDSVTETVSPGPGTVVVVTRLVDRAEVLWMLRLLMVK